MPWQPAMVTTIDGRQCLTDSEEWRRCCEAVHVLSMPHKRRVPWLDQIGKRRGIEGLRVLQDEMSRLEPHYLLAMPDKAARVFYLDQLEQMYGPEPRRRIEQRILAIWHERRAASEEAAA